VNDLGEALEGIQNALEKPERFTSETLSRLPREIEEAAQRHEVYEPFD
jgi:hypothetical protein